MTHHTTVLAFLKGETGFSSVFFFFCFLQALSIPEVIAVKNTIYPSITSLACARRHVVNDQVQSQILPLQVRIMQHKT